MCTMRAHVRYVCRLCWRRFLDAVGPGLSGIRIMRMILYMPYIPLYMVHSHNVCSLSHPRSHRHADRQSRLLFHIVALAHRPSMRDLLVVELDPSSHLQPGIWMWHQCLHSHGRPGPRKSRQTLGWDIRCCWTKTIEA